MANGKKGDHPLTDLFNWGLPAYSPTIDELLKEIYPLVGDPGMDRLGIDWLNPPPLDRFEAQLRELRDRLKKDARERGWEVD